VSRNFKAKVFLVLAGIIVFLFFATGYNVSIRDYSIAIGVGVDKLDNGKYEVSVQTAVPTEFMQLTDDIKFVLSAEGESVAEAVNSIQIKAGKFLDLAHSSIIVIGKDAAESGVTDFLAYLTRHNNLKDSATLVVTDISAKEIMQTQSGLENLSMYALQKVLSFNANDIATPKKTVKDFLADTNRIGSSSLVPLVKLIELGGENMSGMLPPEVKAALFDARQGAIFTDGKMVAELDTNGVKAYNLLKTTIKNSRTEGYDIARKKVRLRHRVSGNTPTLNIYIRLKVKPLVEGLNKREVENEIYKKISALLLTQQTTDILGIQENFYRLRRLQKDNLLAELEYNISVRVDKV